MELTTRKGKETTARGRRVERFWGDGCKEKECVRRLGKNRERAARFWQKSFERKKGN